MGENCLRQCRRASAGKGLSPIFAEVGPSASSGGRQKNVVFAGLPTLSARTRSERDERAHAGGGRGALDRGVYVAAEEERQAEVEALRQGVGAGEIVEHVEGAVAVAEQRIRAGHTEVDCAGGHAAVARNGGGQGLRARRAIETLLAGAGVAGHE